MSSRAAAVDEIAAPPAPTGPLTMPGRILCAALFAWFAGELLYALSVNDRFTVLARYDNPALFQKDQVDNLAVLYQNFANVFVWVMIATLVAFLAAWAAFVFKALSMHAGAGGPSPALAAVSIFIPVLNLFLPYAALKQVWRSTHPADTSGKTPDVLVIWQTAWVFANVLVALSLLLVPLIGAGKLSMYELHTFAHKDLYLASLGLWMGGAAACGISAIAMLGITMDVMKSDAQTA